MKKSIILIPALGLIMACSGGTGQAKKDTKAVSREKTEAIEKSAQKLDETVQSAEKQIDSAQNEIDELLNGI